MKNKTLAIIAIFTTIFAVLSVLYHLFNNKIDKPFEYTYTYTLNVEKTSYYTSLYFYYNIFYIQKRCRY